MNYWLGLHRIAEEEWAPDNATYGGRALAVVRPDDETQSTPAAAGWMMRTSVLGDSMSYVTDSDRGRVLELVSGSGAQYVSHFLLGDASESLVNTGPWGESQRRHVAMWVRINNDSLPWGVTVLCRTTLRGDAQVRFVTEDGTDNVSGDCFLIYIGSDQVDDDRWRYQEWDIAEAISGLDGSDSLAYIDGIVVQGGDNEIYVDDIVISDGRLKRSYSLIPGAVISAVVASQTGPNVGCFQWQ